MPTRARAPDNRRARQNFDTRVTVAWFASRRHLARAAHARASAKCARQISRAESRDPLATRPLPTHAREIDVAAPIEDHALRLEHLVLDAGPKPSRCVSGRRRRSPVATARRPPRRRGAPRAPCRPPAPRAVGRGSPRSARRCRPCRAGCAARRDRPGDRMAGHRRRAVARPPRWPRACGRHRLSRPAALLHHADAPPSMRAPASRAAARPRCSRPSVGLIEEALRRLTVHRRGVRRLPAAGRCSTAAAR